MVGPAGIDPVDLPEGFFFRYAEPGHHLPCGEIPAGDDEDTEHMRVVTEYPVAEPADNDARPLMGQLAYRTALADKYRVIPGRVHGHGDAAVGDYQLPETGCRDILLILLHKIRSVSHLAGRTVNQLPAVARASEPAGHSLPYLVSSAAVHPGNGDHTVPSPGIAPCHGDRHGTRA